MKLRQLKKILNKMSEEQLGQDLLIIACDRTISGFGDVKKSKSNLYYDGEDDPSTLKTMAELKNSYDSDELDGFELVAKRGSFFIEMI